MVLFGVMRATGAVMVPLFVYIFSVLVVRLLLAAALIDRWQADAIWWSFPISAALAVVLAVLYYRYGGWRTSWLKMLAPVEAMRTPSMGGGVIRPSRSE
jgi:Na+-driven multidrug efflux pump